MTDSTPVTSHLSPVTGESPVAGLSPVTPLLSLRDVHKRFHNNEVLKGISLDVEVGEVIAILGPSGSGKSCASS